MMFIKNHKNDRSNIIFQFSIVNLTENIVIILSFKNKKHTVKLDPK